MEGRAGKLLGRLRLKGTLDVVVVLVNVFVSGFLLKCSKRIISSNSSGVGVRLLVISVIRAVCRDVTVCFVDWYVTVFL